MKYKLLYVVFAIVFLAIQSVLTGCGPTDEARGVEISGEPALETEPLEFRPNTLEERSKFRRQPGMVAKSMTGRGTNTREDNILYQERVDGDILNALTSEIKDVDGVEDASVVIHERTVIVGIISNQEEEKVKQEINEIVSKRVTAEEIYVVNDEKGFHEVRYLEGELRNGRAFHEEGRKDGIRILSDLSRILQKPFEHNR
ncbi:YhcN/YlaJ family sporulation lipoprotein [Bacillus sp. FJAT-45350]|uniref:YhcN/YlaJ family sporulation lipoprotein n=1 Tax=Bacillus sp. FJAT-45350 TaxID=2011014 RepID=UPI0015CCAAED|nr:YhcN/YlaJ family sporulation lipoprotein [Bacillus sp. FJAT-45350]